jgi:small subunit ribosomal protein S3
MTLTHNWDSNWFDLKNMANNVTEDARFRSMIMKKLGPRAAIDRIVIERRRGTITLTIHTGRPGVIIGRAGSGMNELRKFIETKVATHSKGQDIKILVSQIKQPELSAAFVAQNIGEQLVKRIAFRRAAKQAIEKTMAQHAQGIKVMVSGRLGGAEIARSEKFIEGKLPLSNFKADIDYAVHHAVTTFGVIGVKVWIYKGDIAREDA